MLTANDVEIVKKFLDEFLRSKDPAMLIAATTEDVVIEAVIAEGTPLSGKFRGREDFARYFKVWADVLEMLDFRDVDYAISGDKIVKLGIETYRVKRTGKVVECETATVLTLREGKIAKFVALAEMSAIVDAYRAEPG